jgi:hypothetical protein
MKNKWFLYGVVFLVFSIMVFGQLTPPSSYDYRGVYSIWNVYDFNVTGNVSAQRFFGEVYWSSVSGRPTHLSNFTDNLGARGYTHLSNFTDNLGARGYTHLSNFSDNLGARGYTHLSNFTDNLGARGYTHLSNFSDNLGARGYTHLSNFTNDYNYLNSTSTGYNKTSWDTAFGWGNHATAGYLVSANLTNYYTKTQTYNQSEVDTLLSNVSPVITSLNRSQIINNWAPCPEGSAQYHENETGRYCDATFLNETDVLAYGFLNSSSTINRSHVVNNWASCPDDSVQYHENETGRYCLALDTVSLSLFVDNLGARGYTHLSNFSDNLGARGYTHLSNFSDNLGARGYTHLSNFTNDQGFITNTVTTNLNMTSKNVTNVDCIVFSGGGMICNDT